MSSQKINKSFKVSTRSFNTSKQRKKKKYQLPSDALRRQGASTDQEWQSMSFNIQQQHLPIIHSVNTRTARYIPAGFFSGREILPSDTESTRSWNSAGTSACFQRSLSKSRLVRNTKERRLRKWNSSACNSVESRLTLCYSSSLERSAQ